MKEKFQEFKTIVEEISDLSQATAVLGWDQQVNMPPAGAEARGNQMAALSKMIHNKATSEELGKLLDELLPYADELDSDSDEARMIKVAKEDYDKATKIPTEFVTEFMKLRAVAYSAWEKAREESDFSSFQPYLEKLVDMAKQRAEFFAPYDHAYDPLLDIFEPGLKTADVKEIFEKIRPIQVELIKAISEKQQVDNSFLFQPFDEDKQWKFGEDVITKYGYDWSRGRQDKATHPFTTNFGVNDVRITTRVDPNWLNPALFATLHEAGHALYEQGVNPEYSRTSISSGASLAIHESQSRLFENLLGRSKPFWNHFYSDLQSTFPAQLGNVDLDTFYKGINKVEPSLIRVEADEATYNLHIMLRLEIELDLIEGKVEVKDLPEVWNAKFEEYLGIVPPNDAEGVLQDVHWSSGLFGYFSTYALGNMVSVQLWEKMLIDIPDVHDRMSNGNFLDILEWMRKNIHVYGSKYKPQELVQRVTGSKIDPEPYLKYLKTKFGGIYGL